MGIIIDFVSEKRKREVRKIGIGSDVKFPSPKNPCFLQLHEKILILIAIETGKAVIDIRPSIESQIVRDRICEDELGILYLRKMTRLWFNENSEDEVFSLPEAQAGIRSLLV
jgi:hypothetical protein